MFPPGVSTAVWRKKANNIVLSTDVYISRIVHPRSYHWNLSSLPHRVWCIGAGERHSGTVVLLQGCSWELSVWGRKFILLSAPFSSSHFLLPTLEICTWDKHLVNFTGEVDRRGTETVLWNWLWKSVKGCRRRSHGGHVSCKIRSWVILSWTKELVRPYFYMPQLKKGVGNVCGSSIINLGHLEITGSLQNCEGFWNNLCHRLHICLPALGDS